MTAPLSPAGMITLFLDGFGLELLESVLKGTGLKDGDSISKEVLEQILN